MDNIRGELLSGLPGAGTLSAVMEEPVPGFLFENCFRDHSITVFVAPAHRGKTLLLLDMALCLDMEIPLFGRFQPLAGRRVFFIGADAPKWDYGLQARKLCIGHGLALPQRKLLDLAGVWRSGIKITDSAFQDWLKDWKKHTNADVLFIDSHRATHGADENSSSAMSQVWDILKSMRDKGWCIIMAHHAGKLGEAVQEDVHAGRGSTIINDASDFIYTLSKKSRKDPRVRVACVKGRGAADEDDPFTFFDIVSVPSTEMLNGRPLYGIKLVAPAEAPEQELQAILMQGPATRDQLLLSTKVRCPEFTKNMSDVAVMRFVDNKLAEFRMSGKAKTSQRGVWEWIQNGGSNSK
jgi:hypothetical protein